tara:strand:+ start:827 stop:1132 length:306 start_codon:yes stop_codon:yes gene_type:complete
MDTFIIIAMSTGLFVSGMSLGAYLENKRLYSVKLVKEINDTLKETQEILLPLGDKISHFDKRQKEFINHTLVDYNNTRDPDITLEFEEEEIWQRKQRSLED